MDEFVERGGEAIERGSPSSARKRGEGELEQAAGARRAQARSERSGRPASSSCGGVGAGVFAPREIAVGRGPRFVAVEQQTEDDASVRWSESCDGVAQTRWGWPRAGAGAWRKCESLSAPMSATAFAGCERDRRGDLRAEAAGDRAAASCTRSKGFLGRVALCRRRSRRWRRFHGGHPRPRAGSKS